MDIFFLCRTNLHLTRKLYEIVENVSQTNAKELVYYAHIPPEFLNKRAQVRWCFMTGCNERPSVITGRCENKSRRKKFITKERHFMHCSFPYYKEIFYQ